MDTVSPNRRRLLASVVAGLLATRVGPRVVAQDATPMSGGLGDGSLREMLARAYDPIPDGGSGPATLFTYGNIARQLEVRGLRSPDPGFRDRDRVSEWLDGIDGLYLDDVIIRNTMLEELWAQLGFDPSQLDQTMTVGDTPDTIRIYRGRFDGRAIERALGETGYERVETDRGTVHTIGRDGDYALTNGVQSIVLNAYNNIAVVEDTYVVAGSKLVDVEAALAVFDGNEATLANNRAVTTLLSAVGEELVSATMIDGDALSVAGMPDLGVLAAATPVATGTIAPAAYALFGLTPGSLPSRYEDADAQLQGEHDDTVARAAFVIALHLGSVEEAEAAVGVIEARYAEGVSVVSGQPYREILGEAEVEAAPSAPVVKVRITGDRAGRNWLRAIFGRDLVFIYTE